eukprot:7866873-Alexandrium_andersonii.AAC.1
MRLAGQERGQCCCHGFHSLRRHGQRRTDTEEEGRARRRGGQSLTWPWMAEGHERQHQLPLLAGPTRP